MTVALHLDPDPEATEEAVIEDGRITSHVVMLTPDSVRQLLVARGTIPGKSTDGEHARHGVSGGGAGK